MRKTLKWVVYLMLIILILLLVFLKMTASTSSEAMKKNWEINIPEPYDITVIFDTKNRDFDLFEIFHYSDSQSNEIINELNSMNIDELINHIESSKKGLDEKESKILSNYIENSNLINKENYYKILDKETRKGFLIYDVSQYKLYYLSVKMNINSK